MIKLACKSLGKPPPIWDLTMGMIASQPTDWPVFKVKAAEARYMVPACVYMATNMFPTSSPYEKLRLHTLKHLQRCYDLLENFDADAMGFHARSFCVLYNQLNRQALTDPRSVRWRLYPKFHLMIHLCETGANPRQSWNYLDESAIGDGARVAETCHPNNMHRALLEDYRIFEYRK